MPAGNLDTTNLLLGIMAAVGVLEALLIIAGGVMAYRLYSHAMRTVREIEERQVAPLVARVNALVARAESIVGTVEKVEETTQRVRHSVGSQVSRVLGLINGAKCAVERIFNGRREAA